MHRLKTRPPSSNSVCDLGIKNANSCRNRYTYVTCRGVYEDLKPRVNVHGSKLRAKAREGEVPASFALGERVNAIPDCANEYGNNHDRNDGSSLALLSNLLKHSFLASLGQALPACHLLLTPCLKSLPLDYS